MFERRSFLLPVLMAGALACSASPAGKPSAKEDVDSETSPPPASMDSGSPAQPDALLKVDAAPSSPSGADAHLADDSSAAPPTDGPMAASMDTAAPGDSAPVALGPFPLEAVKAARPTLYASAGAHLEGPTWRDGDVFFAADGADWGLMRIDAARKLYRYHPKLSPVGSYLLADGSVLWCDHNYVLVQVFKDGSVGQLQSDYQGKAIENCNDITVDAGGFLYLSARHSDTIYRISPGGEVVKVIGGVTLVNGVEVDPQSKYLYFGSGGIQRMAIPSDGSTNFGKAEMFAPIGGADGMQFDAWGNLWIASYGGNQLVVVGPDGKTLASIPVPAAVNFTFGGPRLDTIFIEEDHKGMFQIGPVLGLRGFLHPGAPKYTMKTMLNFTPANTPVP